MWKSSEICCICIASGRCTADILQRHLLLVIKYCSCIFRYIFFVCCHFTAKIQELCVLLYQRVAVLRAVWLRGGWSVQMQRPRVTLRVRTASFSAWWCTDWIRGLWPGARRHPPVRTADCPGGTCANFCHFRMECNEIGRYSSFDKSCACVVDDTKKVWNFVFLAPLIAYL